MNIQLCLYITVAATDLTKAKDIQEADHTPSGIFSYIHMKLKLSFLQVIKINKIELTAANFKIVCSPDGWLNCKVHMYVYTIMHYHVRMKNYDRY